MRTLSAAFLHVPSHGFARWAPAGEAFVAWEPMTAPTNALGSGRGLELVPPGASRAATFAVRVAADG